MSNTNLVLGRWKTGEWPEYVMVSHEGVREASRRYVPERTCQPIEILEEAEFGLVVCHECSKCHEMLGREAWPNYCPSCGAKVVE